jgi:hypothetical protein
MPFYSSEGGGVMEKEVERLGVEKVTLLVRGTGTSVASEATATMYEVNVDKSG